MALRAVTRMQPMKSFPAALACVWLMVMAPLSCAAPKLVKATYVGFMNGMSIGTITEHFESDGASYRVVSETKPVGLAALMQRQPLRFSSSGHVGRDGLHPALFEGRRGANDAPQVAAEFDWSQGNLVMKYSGRTETASLQPGTQDRLSVMYQFMFLPAERLRQLEFAMTNGRKLDRYRYRATPDVEVDTGLGRLKTLHLVKQREGNETATEVWLSPQHQNFPVKLLVVEREGMRLEQVIQSLEVRD